MKNVEMSEATAIAEYEAVRNEILLRLGFQQELIHFTLIAAGLIVPIVGLLAISSIDPHGVLALLLIGPLVSVFLQLIYLKQYAYIQQLSSYIAHKLGLAHALGETIPRDGIPPFSGWERHLNTKLIKSRLVDIALQFTGFAEGLFPSIGGALYLLAFIGSLAAQFSAFNPVGIIILSIWAGIDVILLLGVVVISAFVRSWGVDVRMKDEELPNER